MLQYTSNIVVVLCLLTGGGRSSLYSYMGHIIGQPVAYRL